MWSRAKRRHLVLTQPLAKHIAMFPEPGRRKRAVLALAVDPERRADHGNSVQLACHPAMHGLGIAERMADARVERGSDASWTMSIARHP